MQVSLLSRLEFWLKKDLAPLNSPAAALLLPSTTLPAADATVLFCSNVAFATVALAACPSSKVLLSRPPVAAAREIDEGQ